MTRMYAAVLCKDCDETLEVSLGNHVDKLLPHIGECGGVTRSRQPEGRPANEIIASVDWLGYTYSCMLLVKSLLIQGIETVLYTTTFPIMWKHITRKASTLCA